MNVVTACRHCNGHKRNRLPEESGMELLYAPYVPNKAEYLILTNRRILADQMEFLRQHVAAHSRLVLDRFEILFADSFPWVFHQRGMQAQLALPGFLGRMDLGPQVIGAQEIVCHPQPSGGVAR